jgi:hypothetical protein
MLMPRAMSSLVTLAGLGAAACLATTPPGPGAPVTDPAFAVPGALSSAAPAFLGPGLRDRDEPVYVSPPALVFGASPGHGGAASMTTLSNASAVPIEIQAIAVDGAQAASFALADLPPLPQRLAPGSALSVSVAFAPGRDARPGVYHGRVRFEVVGMTEPLAVRLSAVAFAGAEAEPPLQDIVEALGFAVKVGGSGAVLGPGPAPLGEEIPGPLFKRAAGGPVALVPLACFATSGLSFGYHFAGPDPHEAPAFTLGAFLDGQNRHLHPRLEPLSATTFEPGERLFGLWLQEDDRSFRASTSDRWNPGAAHRARVYPLRFADGAAVPHAYLLAFENRADWDYQDAVFVLWNADPATP